MCILRYNNNDLLINKFIILYDIIIRCIADTISETENYNVVHYSEVQVSVSAGGLTRSLIYMYSRYLYCNIRLEHCLRLRNTNIIPLTLSMLFCSYQI